MGGVGGVVYISPNYRRIEKEFIYRKEKQAQDNAAMAVSRYYYSLSQSSVDIFPLTETSCREL